MTSNSSDKAKKRQERLGAALKANLQKRKMQSRARLQAVDDEGQGEDDTAASKPPQQGD